jgi:hypothetical protein
MVTIIQARRTHPPVRENRKNQAYDVNYKQTKLREFERKKQFKDAVGYVNILKTDLRLFNEYSYFYAGVNDLKVSHGPLFANLVASLPPEVNTALV